MSRRERNVRINVQCQVGLREAACDAAHPWRRELRLVDQARATNCPRIPTSTLPLPRDSFAVERTALAHIFVAIACAGFCYASH